MKTLITICVVMILAACSAAFADYSVIYDFETSWTGDYADGWANEDYRHGAGPLATMEQIDLTSRGRSGFGAKISVDSVAADSQFWGTVQATDVLAGSMDKQYDPWFKADFYDDMRDKVGGQLYAVPSLVTGPDDWTDMQLGVRRNTGLTDYYYTSIPGTWADTGEPRSEGWHELKMQLSSLDGYIRLYIDDTQVGISIRNDYTDLGTLVLSTMFWPPLSDWGADAYSVWDDAEFGSTIPEPTTLCLLGLGVLSLIRKRNKK